MIQIVLTDTRRMFLPLDRVISITENEGGELGINYMNAKGEAGWAKISEFTLLEAGAAIS